MKKTKKQIKNLIYILAVWFCCFNFVNVFTQNVRYVVDADNYLSEDAQRLIHSIIRDSNTNLKNPRNLYQTLREKVPIVQDVTMAYFSPVLVNINLDLQRPELAINEKYVLTQEGSVVLASLLKQSTVALLPNVNMKNYSGQAADVPEGFCSCVKSMSHDVFHDYDVKWFDATKIELQDKNDHNFSIVASCAVLPDIKVLGACHKVKEKELAGKNVSRLQKQKWVADIRFDKQIVFSSKKEEG